jgi:hypothetical protein
LISNDGGAAFPAFAFRAMKCVMIEETTNIVIKHLRHIRGRVDVLTDDMRQVKLRLGIIEGHIAANSMSEASQNVKIDRIKDRLERIERRLELTE